MSDQIELYNTLNINHDLTASDNGNIDNNSPLEHQIQKQEMKGGKFDKFNSMAKYFYKTGEINGSNNVKNPLRTSAILNIENDDHFFFIGR